MENYGGESSYFAEHDSEYVTLINMKKITFTNRSTVTTRLIVEPWAEEYLIAPNISVDIVATGKTADAIEIECVDRGVVVHGWSDGTVTVMRDGVEIVQSPQV